MHGEEMTYIRQAYETNWMSTVGENLDAVEELCAEACGTRYAVALANGTAALHLAIRLAGEELYGRKEAYAGTLSGQRVFCSDMTFDATCNPIAYEGGEAVFIDTESDTWNMDPEALEKAFAAFPDVRMVVLAHLYGTPAKIDAILDVCKRHDAVLIEDAAESLGASFDGKKTGGFGRHNIISFNGNKIITGSAGGAYVTDDAEAAKRIRKWSTQARDDAPWYQHTELGYNYRMSNVIAAVIRGQFAYLTEHIEQKKAIYLRYKEAFADLPLSMNPFDAQRAKPNYWLSCILIDRAGMCEQTRTDHQATFVPAKGKSCPTQIMEALAGENIESRPIWKPMHLQPVYAGHPFVTREGVFAADAATVTAGTVADGAMQRPVDADIFERGLCLPSDNKMTPEQQDRVIDIIRGCFD